MAGSYHLSGLPLAARGHYPPTPVHPGARRGRQAPETLADRRARVRGILTGIVGVRDVDAPLAAPPGDPDRPRAAADLAVLDERPRHVGLDEDFHLLAAVGADDEEAGQGRRLRFASVRVACSVSKPCASR